MARSSWLNSRLSEWFNRARFSVARMCLPRIKESGDGIISMIFPAQEDSSQDSSNVAELMELALAAAGEAAGIDLRDLANRMVEGPRWPNIWPGEHYKLLAGLVSRIQPTTVVEVGTFLGLSALAMKQTLPAGGHVVTFDILSWNSFPATCLRKSDFADRRLEQVVGDLADPEVFRVHAGILAQADLIFLDGPKNQNFERAFLRQLATVRFGAPALLVIDDIHLWSMRDIWRDIPFAKLDVTSLGHFSGTGLVRLNPK